VPFIGFTASPMRSNVKKSSGEKERIQRSPVKIRAP